MVLKQLPSGVNDIQLYQDFVSTLIESSWFVKIWQSLYKGLSLRHICSPEIGNNERIKQGGTTPHSIHMLVVNGCQTFTSKTHILVPFSVLSLRHGPSVIGCSV